MRQSEITPELYARAHAVLTSVREAPPESHAGLIEQHCASDPALKLLVDSLLAQDTDSFLAQPALGDRVRIEDLARPADESGSVWGHYTLLRKIGEGGFGVVYEAERSVPFRQRVAIKAIQHGRNTAGVLRRFAVERQSMAQFSHPNIARALDAGVTPDARPYFAMELVDGMPLHHYCEANALPLRERLRLIATVCRAVHHAHSHGVIHRDLKPGNILVEKGDVGPVPKVIDFGVALAKDEALADGTLLTSHQTIVGTLPYLSAEQAARQSPADVRSDVYALGVTLYQVLSGRLPFEFEGKPAHECLRLITQEAPTRLGRIDRSIPRDVETIVGKAIEKDPARRFQTAMDMADEIDRWLEGRPLTIRPPSAWYRASKLIRRHKGLAAGLAAAFLALTTGLGAASWQAVKNRQLLEESRELNRTVVRDLATLLQNTPGGTEPARILAQRAAANLERLAAIAPNDPGVRLELASSFLTLSRSLDAPQSPPDPATLTNIEAVNEALSILEPHVAGDRPPLDALQVYARAAAEKSRLMILSRDFAGAVSTVEDMLPRIERWSPMHAGDKTLAGAWSFTIQHAAMLDRAGAAPFDRSLLAQLARRILTPADPPADAGARAHFAAADDCHNLGVILPTLGELDEGLQWQRRAQHHYEQALDDPELRADAAASIGGSRRNAGMALGRENRFAEAASEHEEAIRWYDRALEFRPNDAAFIEVRMMARRLLASSCAAAGDMPRAETHYKELAAEAGALRASDPTRAGWSVRYAECLWEHAVSLRDHGPADDPTAESRQRALLDELEGLLQSDDRLASVNSLPQLVEVRAWLSSLDADEPVTPHQSRRPPAP